MANSARIFVVKRFDAYWLIMSVIWVFIDLIPQQSLVIGVKILILLAMLRKWPDGMTLLITLFLILYATINFIGTHWWSNSIRMALQPFFVIAFIIYFRRFSFDQLFYIIKCFTLVYFASLVLGLYINDPIYGSADVAQFGGSRGLVYSGNQLAITISVLAWANILLAETRKNSFCVYLCIVGLFLIATKFALAMACLVWLVSVFVNSIVLIRGIMLVILGSGVLLVDNIVVKLRDGFSVLTLFYDKLQSEGLLAAITNNRDSRFDMFSWDIAKVSVADNFEVDFLNIAYVFSYIGLPLYFFLIYRVLKEGRAMNLLNRPYIFVVLLFFTTGHFTQSVIAIPIIAIFILLFGFAQGAKIPSRNTQQLSIQQAEG